MLMLLILTSEDTSPVLTALSTESCSHSSLCCADTLNNLKAPDTVPGTIITRQSQKQCLTSSEGGQLKLMDLLNKGELLTVNKGINKFSWF